MGSITSGHVSYGRRLNLGDYNDKKAEVLITFACAEDGSDFQKMVDLAATVAIGKVHELLALAAPAAKAAAETAALAQGGGKAALQAQAEAAAGKKPDGAPPLKGGKKAAATPPVPPPAPAAPVTDELEGGGASGGTQEEMEDVLAGSAPEIADAEIMKLVTETAQRTKNPGEVKKLIGKYGCVAPQTCRDIAQDKRQAFITELKAMKSA